MKSIDKKIKKLLDLNGNQFIFVDYYSHAKCDMYKIENLHTNYGKHTLVLCSVDEGFEKALDLAIEEIEKHKKEFWGEEIIK